MSIAENIQTIQKNLSKGITLIAVSKTQPNEAIHQAYTAGQRHFGENKVQELVSKYESLPKDICWHMIGHLQTNKVKYIVPFVHLIHGVDSLKLLREINKQAAKINRVVSVLLQMHIAEEETKFGLNGEELEEITTVYKELKNIEIKGMMGMATFTDREEQIKKEFLNLAGIFHQYKSLGAFGSDFNILSMGMSGDYPLAIQCGSTMIRVGSAIFGSRNY